MAETVTEIDEIFTHINNGHHFLLSGGAGSGKTYTLVEVIKRVFQENPTAQVACITYTNIAVQEIKGRVQFENLRVSTIHDFLWENIASFQKNIKKTLSNFIQQKRKGFEYNGSLVLDFNHFESLKNIEYREWKNLEKGIISHDEVIEIAESMFSNYPLLCDILKDKFDFIFIDEYQDTFKEVVQIFLEHLPKTMKKNLIGFFGDSMQSIFEDGVGNIDSYKTIVKEVIKRDNRRNPALIINLANKLRTDNLEQKPANDTSAPNYNSGEGKITFLYSLNSNISIEEIKLRKEFFEDWQFDNPEQVKELYLTENLIAPKAGFSNLMAIYDKDPVIVLKNDILNKIKGKQNIMIGANETFDSVVDRIAPKNKEKKLKKDVIIHNPNENILYEKVKDLPFDMVKKLYLDKKQLIGTKKVREVDEKKGVERDNLIKHLFDIQECIYLYEQRKYNDFIKKTHFSFNSIRQKIELSENIKKLQSMKEESIEIVIDYAHQTGIWEKTDNFQIFVREKEYVYDRVKQVKYKELCNLYDYVEGKTPFSTQHNIKGAEFDNVFVILDNGSWNSYNFEQLFKADNANDVLKRTQKIFYVCCTRAKKSLVVFYHNPSPIVIDKAKDWFGESNVYDLDII